ncbi:MAG: class I SAM-dependent methyltransferase [Thermoanaerobaculia bacterium]
MSSSYEKQQRGDRSAYERYLAGMDASMKQKVALTAAHLLAQGTVADMGMGSGTGTHALASLYPSLHVIGVDINPTMVELAAARYVLPNLSFQCGDIAAACFPPDSLDAIFDSSVLHHVTTFSGYDYESAARALAEQVRQLKPNGMLIVRDFVDPGPREVVLELPAGETSDLFEQFASEFRKLAPKPGFEYREESPRDGFRRFRLPLKLATEFVLRKDYRRDWDTEILEEYTYFTQERFESIFISLGLRIVASIPLWNPWIVHHRFEGKFSMTDAGGAPLEFPPTNYLIAGERVAAGEGVRLEETDRQPALGFLSLQHFRNRRTGAVMDLVRRPHPTVDLLPWFLDDGELFVLARKSYPRAILSAGREPGLDGATTVHYVTEPLNVLQRDEPFGQTVADALLRRASIPEERIRGIEQGCIYYPSPGGIEEEVRSALVEIEPAFAQIRIENVSGFTTSGYVRALAATQLLRSSQVGGMSDARLELNIYELLRRLGRSAGPWIGDAIDPTDQGIAASSLAVKSRRAFDSTSESSDFLELRCSHFREVASDGSELASQNLEYVVPRDLSINTIATALLTRSRGEVLIGIDDDDLPAAQSFTGNSNLLVAPAWRLPKTVTSRTAAREWIRERLRVEYGVDLRTWWELGGRYHPTPGVTPERVYPYAIDVVPAGVGQRSLTWVPLRELLTHDIRDGHLRIVANRAAHATM